MPDQFWIFIVIVVALRIVRAVTRQRRSGGRVPAPPRDWQPMDLPGAGDPGAGPPPAPDTRSAPDTPSRPDLPSEAPGAGDVEPSGPGSPDREPVSSEPSWPAPASTDEPTWPERDGAQRADDQGPPGAS